MLAISTWLAIKNAIYNADNSNKTGLNAPSTKKIQCFEPIYGEQLNYSKDTYSIFPGDSVEFNVKYPYKNSLLGPNRYLGYVYHCHYMNCSIKYLIFF